MNGNLAKRQDGNVERVKQRTTAAPLVDVYENNDELLLLADVPGASKDGINIHLDNGQLTIEARRSEDASLAPGGGQQAYDYFRAFSVPQGIDASRIDAQLTSGVLRLRLPKSEAVKPRRIDVKGG